MMRIIWMDMLEEVRDIYGYMVCRDFDIWDYKILGEYYNILEAVLAEKIFGNEEGQ